LNYQIEDIIAKPGHIIRLLHYPVSESGQIDTSVLTPNERLQLKSFLSEKRRTEFYYTRILWHQFNNPEEIGYDRRGRPKLSSGHLSISHSGNVIAIGWNKDCPTGVDVEFFSPKIRAVRHKFISAEDENLIRINNDTELTITWSIKEAVYKMEDIPGLSFKDDIHVTITGDHAEVSVSKNGEMHHYRFDFIVRDLYVITYCSLSDLHFKKAIRTAR
jgi:phosphopantetheinyl transferase